MQLSGWGRYPRHETQLFQPESPGRLSRVQSDLLGFVARGNGRAYGDAAVGERSTVLSRSLDRMLEFDAATGDLTVEAGALLADVLATFVRRGFFPPVVPGTKFATIGGMIAADVHGKNQHKLGGFGDHVRELKLVLANGQNVTCSRRENCELFTATIGGMGLTGTIAQATLRLMPIETAWLRSRVVVAADLDGAMATLRDAAETTYSVAWIDGQARGASIGRSLVHFAEHATAADFRALEPSAELLIGPKDRRLAIGFDMPHWVLSKSSVALFNAVHFRQGATIAAKPRLMGFAPYFFPLDAIADWSRLYGRRGFLQHQSVIPARSARSAIGEILEHASHSRQGPFLATLKQLRAGNGLMSFPLEGYTLAMDFPATEAQFRLFEELDRIVVAAGGRIYLAKDARQSRDTFESGYPGLAAFRDIRRTIGADGRIASRLSVRLGI